MQGYRMKKETSKEKTEPKEHRKNWRETYATPEEIETFLNDHIYLRRNVVTMRTEWREPSGYESDGTEDWQPMSDWKLNSLWKEMMKEKPVIFDHMRKIIESDSFTDYHPFDYEGIYSQAYALYQQGFQYWFSREEIKKLSEHNKAFEADNLEKELVQLYFRKPAGEEAGEFMPVSLAMQMIGSGITQKLSKEALGHAFIELGFTRKTFHNMRGYIVVRRSAEEMQSLRRAMAQGSDNNTHTDITLVF